MSESVVPTYYDLLWPTLQAVIELGGSARLDEIVRAVISNEGYTEALQSVPHGDGPQTEIEYRLAWARTYLKGGWTPFIGPPAMRVGGGLGLHRR